MPIETYLSTASLAKRWEMNPKTLRNWRSLKYGPQAVKFLPRRVLYPMSAVLEWEQRT